MSERGNYYLRFLDAFLGPILLRLLVLVYGRAPLTKKRRRIGVMCLGALGDLLLISAVVRGLQAAFPEASIFIIGSSSNKGLAPFLGVAQFELLSIKRFDKALSKLRSLNLDVLLDSSQWARLPAILSLLSRVHSIGFRTIGQGRHYGYSVLVDHRNDLHEIENFKALASRLVCNLEIVKPHLNVTNQDRDYVSRLELGRYVVFHPWPAGIRSDLKKWPTENWVAVASFIEKYGLSIVLTGSRSDVKDAKALAGAISNRASVVNMTGKCTLGQVIALLENTLCTIAVNTGVMHMAAALGRPLLALHGPTNPIRWGPLSDNAIIFESMVDGCGYLNLGFEYPRIPPNCMSGISPAMVCEALNGILNHGV